MTAARKILIVDDDPIVGRSFDRVLSGKDYAVITAENGEEALRKLAEEEYDVVYTDIRMPGMSGLEVAEEVRARRPWTPVVIITGYGSEAAEARAKAAGVAGFLNKPLTPEMIEVSARDALAAPATVADAPAPAAAAPSTARSVGLALRNIGLFLAAPFIALAYVIALPFVGLGLLAVMATKAVVKNETVRSVGMALRNIGLFLAAPFVALAYVMALPFVGLGLLAVMMARAAAKNRAVRSLGRALKNIGLFLAAPVVALAFVLVLPFVGLVMLAWVGGRATVGAGAR